LNSCLLDCFVVVRGVLYTQSHSTPSVVFLSLNINMGTAIPRATNAKNRPTLGAIFSVARAARAAKFGSRVVLEGPYNISFTIWYFHFRFGNYGLKKSISQFFSKTVRLLENIYIPRPSTVQVQHRYTPRYMNSTSGFGATPSRREVP